MAAGDNHSIANPEIDVLARKLQDSDSTISDLKAEVVSLKSLVEQLSCENKELRSRLSQAEVRSSLSSHKLNGDSVSQSMETGLLFVCIL